MAKTFPGLGWEVRRLVSLILFDTARRHWARTLTVLSVNGRPVYTRLKKIVEGLVGKQNKVTVQRHHGELWTWSTRMIQTCGHTLFCVRDIMIMMMEKTSTGFCWGSNVTLNLGQFPEMRFYPHISFSEIDLQLNATFDSTPPFRDFNKAQNKKSGLRRIQS